MTMYTNFRTLWVAVPPLDEILFQTNNNVLETELPKCLDRIPSGPMSMKQHVVSLPGFNLADHHSVHIEPVNKLISKVNVNLNLNINTPSNAEHNHLPPLTIVPFHLGDQLSLDDPFKATLLQVAKFYNVDIFCTRTDVYELFAHPQNNNNNTNYLYIIGNQTDVSQLQPVIQFMTQDYNLSQRINIPSKPLGTISLAPNNQNLDFFKWAYHVDCYHSTHHPSDFYLGAYDTHTTEATMEYLKSMYSMDLSSNLNQCVSSFTNIYNIPMGKIEFLKKYRINELNTLAVNHQSNIEFGAIDPITHSCPIIINTISNHLANSVIRHLSLNFLQNIIEITFYYDSMAPSLSQLYNHILKDHEYVIVLPSDDNNAKHNCFTLIMDYNKLLSIIDQIIALQPHTTIKQFKIIFQIHYDFENFISGKKNGKLTRIMDQQPNCIIRLLNDKNGTDESIMNLELLTDSTTDLVKTLSLVIDELPVEESFYIGEVFHRPIIGSGGSIIQTIMRKYNVFIQFSNSFNLPQLGWSLIRYPNVIIRCPNKNYKNIKSAREEICQLVNQFIDIQQFDTFNLTPAMYQYIIINKKHSLIPQIEKNFNVSINFPQTKDMYNHHLNDPFILKIGSSNTISSNLNDSHINNNNNNNTNNKKTSYNALINFKELVCGNETHLQMSDNFETFIKDELNWFKDSIILQVESLCKSVLKVSPDNKSLQLIYPTSKEYEIVLRYLDVLNDKFGISIISKKHILGSP